LDDGKSSGYGLYAIYPSGSSETVYCDMTSNGGGWQLVAAIPKSAQPSSLRYQSEYSSNIMNAGSLDNPSDNYMYKGDLSRFSAAKESIYCLTASDCKNVYGGDIPHSGLNRIRSLMGSTARNAIKQSEIPSCTSNYSNFTKGIYDKTFCANAGFTANQHITSVTGWQVDVDGAPYCWMMRSNYTKNRLRGSGLCRSAGEPNGTRHGLLWMR